MNNKIKYIIFCVGIVSLLLALSLGAQTIVGNWQAYVQDGNRTDYKPIKFFSEKSSYVKGGVSFTYPEGYFSTNPYICVTVELKKLGNSSAIEISPLITKNTIESVSVVVNKTIVGLLKTTVNQAETDDVIVHILAYGL